MKNLRKVQAVAVKIIAAVSIGAAAFVTIANADEYASPERTAAAVGHYARARALLMQALDEFEQGRKIARPDLLLDADEFRISLVSRADELNRVLDPQPKVTRSGVRFKGSPDLVRDPRKEKSSSDFVAPAPAAVTPAQPDTFGMGGARGALNTKKEAALPLPESDKPKPAKAVVRAKKPVIEPVEEPVAVKSEPLAIPSEERVETQPKAAAEELPPPAALKEEQPQPAASADTEEDPEVKQAIEQAIKERLDRIKAETDPAKH